MQNFKNFSTGVAKFGKTLKLVIFYSKEENRKLASADSVYVPKKNGLKRFLCGKGKKKSRNRKNGVAASNLSQLILVFWR